MTHPDTTPHAPGAVMWPDGAVMWPDGSISATEAAPPFPTLTKPAFTPGPYFAHDYSGLHTDPSCRDITVSCDHPAEITVAVMGNGLTATLDEARATATLFAAAPDLFEALTEMKRHAALFNRDTDPVWCAIRDMADAALSRALGGQP